MAYSATAVYMCMKYFDEKGWDDYLTEVTKNGNFQFLVPNFGSQSKLRNFNLVAVCYESEIQVVAVVQEDIPPERYSEMCQLINKINIKLLYGGFRIDESDLSFEMRTDFEEGMISERMLKKTISIPVGMIQDFASPIYDVLMGLKTAQQAIRAYDI